MNQKLQNRLDALIERAEDLKSDLGNFTSELQDDYDGKSDAFKESDEGAELEVTLEYLDTACTAAGEVTEALGDAQTSS